MNDSIYPLAVGAYSFHLPPGSGCLQLPFTPWQWVPTASIYPLAVGAYSFPLPPGSGRLQLPFIPWQWVPTASIYPLAVGAYSFHLSPGSGCLVTAYSCLQLLIDLWTMYPSRSLGGGGGEKVSILTQRIIKVTICNHQSDSPLFVWPDVWSGDLQV